ncbi:hypothetical protein HWV62_16896 [Athelia sp. TMB]|nr:hypothetical protein HWV62_16896 [Athelia sp. TMB]
MMLDIIRKDTVGGPQIDPVVYYDMPRRSQQGENQEDLTPSALFARVPSTGRSDISFCLYRYAQYASDSNLDVPVAHPALQCYEAMSGPDLLWDLTARLDFARIARIGLSNIIPLYPEEFATYLTHPPLAAIEVRFDAIPLLSFALRASGGFGVTVRDFMDSVALQLARRFTLHQWSTQITESQRVQILRGYQRRTGAQFDVARRARAVVRASGSAAAQETEYIVSDMLVDEPMFLGISMEDGDPGVWTVYTCKREQCRGFPDL